MYILQKKHDSFLSVTGCIRLEWKDGKDKEKKHREEKVSENWLLLLSTTSRKEIHLIFLNKQTLRK